MIIVIIIMIITIITITPPEQQSRARARASSHVWCRSVRRMPCEGDDSAALGFFGVYMKGWC